jgi:Putative restriction endonuclease
MPHLKKAELIEGVVYVPSPMRHRQHGAPHAQLISWLGLYAANTPGVEVSDNSSVRLDLDNEPQPDALLFIDPACGSQVRISADGIILTSRRPQPRHQVEDAQDLRPVADHLPIAHLPPA